MVEEDVEAMQAELKEAFRLYDKEGKAFSSIRFYRNFWHKPYKILL